MLAVRVAHNSIRIGRHFSVSFERTLRIPDDGREYPLPPGLEEFPVMKVSDYRNSVPDSWRKHGGVFIPVYQREAMWLCFDGAYWRPNAVKIGVGKINAVSGKPWDQSLRPERQDYIVTPQQPWLDGINAGKGFVRQFVAMPLGMGYTVEGQLTGKEEVGGIQIIVYDPKPGRFPEEAPLRFRVQAAQFCLRDNMSMGDMGLGAGGRMKQEIYPDRFGFKSWDEENYGRVFVHLVNSMMYREITGLEPPGTPVTAKEYSRYGLPWFDLYDEGKGGVPGSDVLAGVKTVKGMDLEMGFSPQQDDETIVIPESQVKALKSGSSVPEEWEW